MTDQQTPARLTAKRAARGLTREQVATLQSFAHGVAALRCDRLETWQQPDRQLTVASGRNGWGDLDFAVWVATDGRVVAEMTVDNMSADSVTVERTVPTGMAEEACHGANGGTGHRSLLARLGLVSFLAGDDAALAKRALAKVDELQRLSRNGGTLT